MIDVLAVLKGAKALADFVEGGPLANALADVGLQAAGDALRKVPHARAADAQVWSAVNHLEEALAAVEGIFARRGRLLVLGRMVHADNLLEKRDYILSLMAVCYRYLGEDELARQSFVRARALPPGYPNLDKLEAAIDANSAAMIAAGVAMFGNPMTWIDMRQAGRFRVAVDTVEEAAFALPPRSRPPSLPVR
jgi:hypothetical protein